MTVVVLVTRGFYVFCSLVKVYTCCLPFEVILPQSIVAVESLTIPNRKILFFSPTVIAAPLSVRKFFTQLLGTLVDLEPD